MPPDDETALLDIALAARRIAQAIDGVEWLHFSGDLSLQETVLYRLIIMGEAVKRLSPGFRERHPNVAWQAIAGLRDILVHAYERVNLELIWNVAQRDVAQLRIYIEPLVPSDEDMQ